MSKRDIDPRDAIQQSTVQIVGEEFSEFLDPTHEPKQEQYLSFADAEYLLTRFTPGGKGN